MEKVSRLFLNFTALITAFFISLNAVFYQGFVKNHFFVSAQTVLLIYLISTLTLFLVKKITLSPIFIKINRFCFPILIIIPLILFGLEQYNYPNFVYGHFHININNFLWLTLLSGFIFYLYDFKKLQKHIYLIIPTLAVFISKKISFGGGVKIELVSSFTYILLNFFVWLIIFNFFISLFKKLSDSIIGFIIFFFIFNFISYYKIKSWNQPLSLGDIYLIGSFKEFAISFLSSNQILIKFLFSLISLIFFVVLIKKLFKQKNPKLSLRLKLGLISILFFIIPFNFPRYLNQFTNWLKIKPSPANPLDYCRDHGVIFCFYNDLQNFKTPTPQNYSQEKINQIYSNLNSLPSSREVTELNEVSRFQPNVIVILSEALFDSTKLPVKLSQDPIPNIRQDQQSNLISPQFGGGTANIEFEIITGLSNYFLNGKVPYSQSIYQDIPTIFTLFKENNYTTSVVHPYLKSMFNRSSVYKHFGVDQFTAIEDMDDYEKTGPYVSDKSFTQQILKQFNSTDQPQLIFAISMQNHFPFEGNRFAENLIKINDSLAQDEHNSLETYINGTYYSDQAYLQLKQALEESNKPTVIILYGDHLPLLNNDFGIYKEVGFIPQSQSDWTQTDNQNLYLTPISVWANFSTDTKISSNIISPNFLSLEIFKLANIQPKYQFEFLNNFKNTDTILSNSFTPKFSQQQLSDYELIQYDILSGKQYTLDIQ